MELNNRELAALIWIAIFVVGILVFDGTRNSVLRVLKTALQVKLSTIYGVMAAYIITIVYVLHSIELWDSSQLKNTTLWFFTVGLISLKDIVNEKQTNLFKKTVLDILSLTPILQFITSIYTYSVVTEFVLIPVTFIMGAMIATADKNPSYRSVKRLLNGVLVLAGIFTIGFTIYKIITEFAVFANVGTLNDFMIPAILSLTFLPLVYLLSTYAARENVFVSLQNVLNPSLLRSAKWYTLLHFRFNKNDLQRWKRHVFLRNIESKDDLRHSIKFIKHLKTIEKEPPSVPIEIGWSPYQAQDVLTKHGIISSHYQPSYSEEWSSSALYLENNDYSTLNSIGYSIVGNAFAAKEIDLILKVGEPANADILHHKMINLSNILYQFSTGQEMPEIISHALTEGRNVKLKVGNRLVTVCKNFWPSHKMKGYGLSLTFSIIE